MDKAIINQSSAAVCDDDQSNRILVFPSPGHGHTSPILQLCKHLAFKGVSVTLVTTTACSSSIHLPRAYSSIKVEVISDGSEQVVDKKKETLDESLERFGRVTAHALADLINKIKTGYTAGASSDSQLLDSNNPIIKLFVYDSSIMPWLSDIALQHGIAFAPFFTQSCAVTAIYHQFHQRGGYLLPCLPPLRISDIPSFLHHHSNSYPALFNLSRDQFSNLSQANCLLWNTFDTLEHEVLEWMSSTVSRPIMTVGPTIPSMFLDKRYEDDQDYSFKTFIPDDVDACIKWLDCQEFGSVVYVSFGSCGSPSKEQMEEIAWGLKNTDYNILW